jgi:hypothetical protein
MGRKNHPNGRGFRAQHSFPEQVVERRLSAISRNLPATDAAVRRVNNFGPIREKEIEAVRKVKSSKCCNPFPYAVFRSEALISLVYVHRGARCLDQRVAVTVGAWRAA